MSGGRKVRVLVVDDSAVTRELLTRGLSRDPEIDVVGKASDVYAARDKIIFLKPDVITLDVEMPRMDGIAFLRKLMPQYPVPTVIVSAVTADGSQRALEALDAGALEIVAKPSAVGQDADALNDMFLELAEKIKVAARADVSNLKSTRPITPRPARTIPAPRSGPHPRHARQKRRLLAIGASTGGTIALHHIVEEFPPSMPPIVIVQHMPPVFTRKFAEALDRTSQLTVLEAEEGMLLKSGTVLVAPGNRHLRIVARKDDLIVRLADGQKVCGHRPSVDVLFFSIAESVGAGAVGALLTGMGRDGAEGLLAMRRAGARCVVQDEASSVVWGMPREAWDIGAAESLVPLNSMARELLTRLDLRDGEGAWPS